MWPVENSSSRQVKLSYRVGIIVVIITLFSNIIACSRGDVISTRIIGAEQKQAPSFKKIPDQIIQEGERFKRLFINDYLEIGNLDSNDISLHHWGQRELDISLIDSSLVVRLPNQDWYGSEVIHIEACATSELCKQTEVIYKVKPVNDPPVISSRLIDQLVQTNQDFSTIDLSLIVTDIDNSKADISWHINDAKELNVDISAGIANITKPTTGWQGSERLTFQACDLRMACDQREITFTSTPMPAVLLTFVSNCGFLITSGQTKILVDATFDHCAYAGCMPDLLQALKTAQSPFDDVDLLLATHSHYDHFDADVSGEHLLANPDSSFISTQETIEMLTSSPRYTQLAERMIGLDIPYGEIVDLDPSGIVIQAFRLPHNSPNLAFLFNLPGGRLLHLGDGAGQVDYLPEAISNLDIDVLLITQYELMSGTGSFLDVIQPRFLIPSHFPTGDISDLHDALQNYFPNIIIFRESMESWVLRTE